MITEEKKKEISNGIKSYFDKNFNGEVPSSTSTPFLDGDVLTLAVPESKNVMDIVTFHPATVQNGRTINQWGGLRLTDGREVSITQVARRSGNGLGLKGDTTDARLADFLEVLADKGTVSIKVARSRVQPSTNPEYNGTRVITWEPLSR